LTASAALLAQWKVKAHLGRRVTALDVKTNVCTLDDGTKVEYDDCLIATGSAPVRAPVPGADGRNVHSFWTLDECRGVIASIAPGSHVVIVGAGFISFTILNSILALGAKLTIVDVAEGRDLVSGQPAVHAIEPTAQEHGRVVGANMAGKDVAYKGSLIVNIVEVCHLDAASFGAWDDAKAEAVSGLKRDRAAYRKLLFSGDRLTGAIIIGRSGDVWTTNDVGMLKGLVQTGVSLGRFKDHLKAH